MKKIIVCLALLSSIHAFAKEPIPSKITGLKNPESVLQDKDGTIYITEIGEFGKDGDGQITKIDKKGNIKVFAKGMDDPKGIVQVGKMLYVADKTRVLEVSVDGTWQVYGAQMAFPSTPVFLNDIVADNAGNLYVSDSGSLKDGGQIFKIAKSGVVSIVADYNNPDILAPNGLLFEGRNQLLSVDFESGILYRINLANGATTKIAEGFSGGDGLVKTKSGKIFISDWKNGVINQLSGGKARLFKNGLTSAADMALSANGEYLLVPLMKVGELEFIPLNEAKPEVQ
ncbi:MAG: gluconolaconase [Methylophilaceae bacterium 17-44-8]|jgi:sugar lactone lactonase YvrE|nr:MAG: gluconolaconase [Methylophilales bacterium 28-44-11]OZA06998.1 MAG: gluconolaconase [Methylophilaceae bacterium 17-44-8]